MRYLVDPAPPVVAFLVLRMLLSLSRPVWLLGGGAPFLLMAEELASEEK